MLPTLGARPPVVMLAAAAAFVLIFIFGFWSWGSSSSYSQWSKAGPSGISPPSEINDIVHALFADLKVKPDAPVVRDGVDGELKLPENPRYTTELGKKVLVLDLDTRPLESTKAFEEGKYNWRHLNHVSAGAFSHYTYAMVHGYDYKFIQAENFEDRHATWIKPSAIGNELKKYEWIVFLDADATFRYMHLPLEWLLNYWEIRPEHSLTMALDPWDPNEPQYNSDHNNRTLTNTGFMLVQNNPHTMEILKAWHECPDDTRYSGCSYWKNSTHKFHEQSAFGEYIRYDYENYIKELPCAEANGFPGVKVSQCEGRFIRHYWFEKSLVKKDFGDNFMQAFTLPIQRHFAQSWGGPVVKTGKNELHQRELLV